MPELEVCAVLFDTAGNQLGCVQKNGSIKKTLAIQEVWILTGTNWKYAHECIIGVLDKTKLHPAEIAAISTTCMREGIVLYDADGNEIWACANVDGSSDEVAELIQMNPNLKRKSIQFLDKPMLLVLCQDFYGLKQNARSL